jgi:hypothetical protein
VSRDESRPPRLPNSEALNEEQRLALNAAVEKLLQLGQRVGVGSQQIVALLNSGMEVDELVRYLVSKVSRAA